MGFIKRMLAVGLTAAMSISGMAVCGSAANLNPAKAKIRIACIGDSITAGSGGTPYTTYLQSRLGSNYTVLNYGVGGTCAMDDAVIGVGANAQPYCYKSRPAYQNSLNSKPDIVIIMLGTNDAKKQNWYSDYPDLSGVNLNDDAAWSEYESALKAEFTQTNAQAFYNDYKALIQDYIDLAAAPKVYLATSCVVYKDWDADSRIRSGDNILDEVVSGQIVPIQKQIAEELGIEVIDINAYTAQLKADGVQLSDSSDGLHPNKIYDKIGYKFAEVIAEEIDKSNTAQDIADNLTISNPKAGVRTLTTPKVPNGYTVELTGSDNAAINIDGTITPDADNDTIGKVTFTVTKISDNTTALFEPELTVPAYVIKNGLIEENGATYFYSDDVRQSGFQTVDSKTYYFNPTSFEMNTSPMIYIDGRYYLFKADSSLAKQELVSVADYYAYADENGVCIESGCVAANNGGIYLIKNGIVQCNVLDSGYVYGGDGKRIKNGWADINGLRYYAKADGSLYINTVFTVNGKSYYADKNGVVQMGKTGNLLVKASSSSWYVADKNGVILKRANGKKLVKVGTKSYIVNKLGVVQKSDRNMLVRAGSKSYIVNKNGVVQKGKKNKLVKVGKKSYIVNSKGVVQKNKKSVKVGKKTYKINKNGVAVRKEK